LRTRRIWARLPANPSSDDFRSETTLIVYEVGTDEVVIHYVRHGARRRPWEGEE